MCSAMYLSKKRVERSTVAILKLEVAQSGDGPSPDDDAKSDSRVTVVDVHDTQ